MTLGLTYASFESSGGAKVHRLPLQAFPSFGAYVYIVQKNEYCFLIDAGSGTETYHQNLLDGLQQAALQPSALTHILNTHAHIDHYGGLTRLRSVTQAKIRVHELDVQTIAHHVAIRLDDLVLCGDMVVEGVTPHLSPESINPYSGLNHYHASSIGRRLRA
jgi:ribonuclease BN (tRNA processing enzyme)